MLSAVEAFMRSSFIALSLALLACSGESTRSGNNDGDADGGGSERGGSSGEPGGGTSPTSGHGGAGAQSNGGASAGGASGASAGGASGDSMGGASTSGRGGSEPTGGTSGRGGITSCSGEFPFTGVWTGNRLDFFFEPLESLELVVAESETGELAATFRWGEGDPPPPPAGPDEPPLGYDQSGMGGRGGSGSEPWPGFVYTVQRGAACDGKFRFDISAHEIHADWCALQTPVYTEDYGWGCTLQGGGSSDQTTCTVQTNDGQMESYPAHKCFACAFGTPICACDENGCTASSEPTHVFDLMRLEDAGDVILTGPDPSCPDCTVRLLRTE
jgi:hypothetical protein